jgi:PTS system mannitol-specific IIC component
MGSSAMGASSFRKKVQKSGLDITVKNYSLENVPEEADIIVCHKDLCDRARATTPDKEIVVIDSFIGDPKLEELLDRLIGKK